MARWRVGVDPGGTFTDIGLFDEQPGRVEVRLGNRFARPAIVEQRDATTLVLPGAMARIDAWLNLVLEVAA